MGRTIGTRHTNHLSRDHRARDIQSAGPFYFRLQLDAIEAACVSAAGHEEYGESSGSLTRTPDRSLGGHSARRTGGPAARLRDAKHGTMRDRDAMPCAGRAQRKGGRDHDLQPLSPLSSIPRSAESHPRNGGNRCRINSGKTAVAHQRDGRAVPNSARVRFLVSAPNRTDHARVDGAVSIAPRVEADRPASPARADSAARRAAKLP